MEPILVCMGSAWVVSQLIVRPTSYQPHIDPRYQELGAKLPAAINEYQLHHIKGRWKGKAWLKQTIFNL